MKLPIFQTSALPIPLMWMALIAGFSLAMSAKATVPVSSLPDFDNLPNFGQLGNNLSSATASVNGNVGVSDGGSLSGPGFFTINGNFSVGNGASVIIPSTVTGTTLTGQNLSLEQSTVFSASAGLAALPPDQTISSLETGPLSFDVPAGQVRVVNLDGGLNLSGGNGITVTGGGGLVLNIGTGFTIAGGGSITGPASNIFINYLGSATADLSTALIDGQIFIPGAATQLSAGAVNGGVFTGDSNINLSLGQVINAVPVPEPGAMALAAMGGLATILLRHRSSGLKNQFNERKQPHINH